MDIMERNVGEQDKINISWRRDGRTVYAEFYYDETNDLWVSMVGENILHRVENTQSPFVLAQELLDAALSKASEGK